MTTPISSIENRIHADALFHPEIWERAYPAIQASRRAASDWIASGGFCNEHVIPDVEIEESGWPEPVLTKTLHEPRMSSLLDKEPGSQRKFNLADLEEVSNYYEYCRSRTDLVGTLFPPTDLPEPLLRFAEDLVDQLFLGVLDRCEAVGAFDEDAVLSIYADAENSIFSPELEADVLFPIVNGTFRGADTIFVDAEICIEVMDISTQRLRTASYYDSMYVHPLILRAASHAVVVRGVMIDNTNPWSRGLRSFTTAWFDGLDNAVIDRVDKLFRALRITANKNLGYAQLLCRPIGWADSWKYDLPPLTVFKHVKGYPDALVNNLDYSGERIALESISDEISATFRCLETGPAVLQLASRRWDMAMGRLDPDDQVLDCTIGLEALLGKEKTEISHRLALRCAALLGNGPSVETVYQGTRALYNRRSEIIHGVDKGKNRTLKINESEVDAQVAAVLLLRLVIQAVIRKGGSVSPESLDKALLEALATKTRPEPSESVLT